MTIDRRKQYYAKAGAIARESGLEFQRRYLAGIAFQAALRARDTLKAANVTVMRRRVS